MKPIIVGMKEMTYEFKMEEITFKLDSEGLNEFLSLIREFLTLQGLRMSIKDFPFIEKIFYQIGFKYKFREIFELAQARRKEHVDWFLGKCEDDGIEKLRLPKTYDELRELLEQYDDHWTGFDK